LRLGELFTKCVDKVPEDLASIVNLLGVLPNNPDQGSSCIRLIELVDALTEGWNDALVTRVLPEDVLDDYDGLLHHIVDFRVDEIE